ncbi:Crp/Fnr family transcriptional regulator [Natranaerobius thermophilus]|uniref:Transcriptional regulator, Crp/Fnr family n=1 Tax=Natranaerobius thermophilus (strain ATCC BAA-1301 / DSM 18059 / JW/NM-WN-LF) TaxID=457570 RepID=B2A710_NATTJ|nr:Crp/Fnr family transcriptional regulator [Natranaerobius thermophilus]ACB85601.1 transcriptional regulator, Crp/Fnr family [Natranaerobius thermophilus JW/NM-WN-LF]
MTNINKLTESQDDNYRSLMESLRKLEIFSHLTEDELNSISKLAYLREFPGGSVIFYHGDPGEAMYYVKDGKVKIVKDDFDGREQILHIMKPGDIFAEVVVFDDGPYPATAEVMEDTVVGVITKERLENHLHEHPTIAIKIMKLMGKRLRKAQSKVADLALRDTYQRTINIIYNLMEEDDCAFCSEKQEIAITATHQELASMAGTSRETVTRVLSTLKKEGIIKTDKGYIAVTDPVKLKDKVIE